MQKVDFFCSHQYYDYFEMLNFQGSFVVLWRISIFFFRIIFDHVHSNINDLYHRLSFASIICYPASPSSLAIYDLFTCSS